MKMNDLLNKNIEVYGFEALKQFAGLSNKDGDLVVLSSLSPAIMQEEFCFKTYYSPVIPRNSVFKTADDLLAADLDVQLVSAAEAKKWDEDIDPLIVSRHQGTIDLLKSMYPYGEVASGNLTEADVTRKHVIGTLPPNLIQFCISYRAVTIKDFDYNKDEDLQGTELKERLEISDPIKVKVLDENKHIICPICGGTGIETVEICGDVDGYECWKCNQTGYVTK